MFRVHVIVREAGGTKPEFSLDFELPVLPRVGSYLSIEQGGEEAGATEDIIVRHVWWRLSHPERDSPQGGPMRRAGYLRDVVIECAKAIGPYSTDAWREDLLAAERAGFEVETFDVEPRVGGFAFEPTEPISTGAVRRARRRQREAVSAPLGRGDPRRRQQ